MSNSGYSSSLLVAPLTLISLRLSPEYSVFFSLSSSSSTSKASEDCTFSLALSLSTFLCLVFINSGEEASIKRNCSTFFTAKSNGIPSVGYESYFLELMIPYILSKLFWEWNVLLQVAVKDLFRPSTCAGYWRMLTLLRIEQTQCNV